MTRDELIQRLDELAELNKESTPLAAGVLYALSALCTMNSEEILAAATKPIIDDFLSTLKTKLKTYEN